MKLIVVIVNDCTLFILMLHLQLLCINTALYIRNNLYNTNDNFDYGGFRALMEAQSQVATSTTLFAYKFTDPGVYAFYLSTDINKKMVRSDQLFVVAALHLGPVVVVISLIMSVMMFS